MNGEKSLEISWGTILRISLAIFCFYIILLVKDILILSVFGLVISILFETPIRILEKRIPRSLAVIFVYIFAFSIICLLVYLPASRFISEIRQFGGFFPNYFEQIAPVFKSLGVEAFKNVESFTEAIEKIIQMSTNNIFNILFSIFGGISSTIFVISIAVFLSFEGRSIEKNLVLLFPKNEEGFIVSLWRKCQKRVGFWFLTSILSSLFVGVACFLAFSLLKIKYPLSLGLAAGSLNFVPVLGSILAAFLIFAVSALDSTTKAVFAVIAFIIIQQIDNNIVMPLVSKKLVGLSPALILISLTIGGRLFGILGAILMVPLMGVVFEFLKGLLIISRKVSAES